MFEVQARGQKLESRLRGSKKQQRRQRILEAAKEVLRQDPDASLATVAKAAEVGRATLYRHFENRDQLLEVLAEEAMNAFDRAAAGVRGGVSGAQQWLDEIIRVVVATGAQYHFLWVDPSVMRSERVEELYRRQRKEMRALVEAVKAEGALRLDVSTGWIVSAIDALMFGAWEAIRRGDIAPNDAPDLVMETFLGGLARRPEATTAEPQGPTVLQAIPKEDEPLDSTG